MRRFTSSNASFIFERVRNVFGGYRAGVKLNGGKRFLARRRRQSAEQLLQYLLMRGLKDQHPEPLGRVKRALQSWVPGQKGVVGAITAIEVQAPTGARLGLAAAEL